jgi:LacI family transcriptional regulator
MEKRITIKDIAQKAGVSAGTVHRALTGKAGVGDECRERVIRVAQKEGYRPNYVASSLKRKTLRIFAVFPGPTENNRFFYTQVWQGFRDYIQEISDYNLSIIELPYYNGLNNQANELQEAFKRYEGEIDGLITVGHVDERGEAAIRSCIEYGIPVMLVCDDIKNAARMGCVQANYDVTGRMIAELLCSQIPEDSSILMCGGDVMVSSHYRMVQGFDAYLEEIGSRINVIKVNGYHNSEDVRARIRGKLETEKSIAAVCSVSARGSVMLAEELSALGLAGKVKAIGSDLFEENIKNLKAGILTNIIYKNPYRQAYLATKLLIDYLIKDERPIRETFYVDSIMVFRSNVSMYENGYYRTNL